MELEVIGSTLYETDKSQLFNIRINTHMYMSIYILEAHVV